MDGIKNIGPDLSYVAPSSIDNKLNAITTGSESRDIAKAKEAAKQFEALLLHQMFNSMSANVSKDSLLGGGREDEFARDMYNQALADSIAKGQGIGIRDILERELVNKVKGLSK